MFEIYKALQQAMKLTYKAKDYVELKARLSIVGILSEELAHSVADRILEINDPNENQETLH